MCLVWRAYFMWILSSYHFCHGRSDWSLDVIVVQRFFIDDIVDPIRSDFLLRSHIDRFFYIMKIIDGFFKLVLVLNSSVTMPYHLQRNTTSYTLILHWCIFLLFYLNLPIYLCYSWFGVRIVRCQNDILTWWSIIHTYIII